MPTRRRLMITAAAATAALTLPAGRAAARTWDEAMAAWTDGAAVTDGGVTITAPEIAENGQAVPIMVEAPGATEILILNTRNPEPGVARVRFLEAAGAAMIATRIRLGETQDIIALARFPDGRIGKAQVEVKVTIGGCGG
jgi:sulfur-oxidizing protein SoxY